jgi:hypothetical protein
MDPAMTRKEGQLPESSDQATRPRCPLCNALPVLVDRMLDPRKGRIVRLYRCSCGERIWDE